MKRIIPIFLIPLLFMVIACPNNKVPDTRVEEDTNTFVSKQHGSIAIMPTFKYMGEKINEEGKGIRRYFVWENNYDQKYIVILQLIPKEGVFPIDLDWTPKEGSLYIKGFRAAYDSIADATNTILLELGAIIPDCFILAEEVHVKPTEALFRILIVPDKMCSGDYESVMEELDRVIIINPLG